MPGVHYSGQAESDSQRGFAAQHQAPVVSAEEAIGAESEYIKGVKASRAKPGRPTARAPC